MATSLSGLITGDIAVSTVQLSSVRKIIAMAATATAAASSSAGFREEEGIMCSSS
ncbi:MAG: hypothetical protein WB607_15750 [Candidatus Acidiferrum sp.]